MLLIAEAFDDSERGTLLSLWFLGGDRRCVDPPCRPRFFTDGDYATGVAVRRRLLSKPSVERTVTKVEFPNMQTLKHYAGDDSWEAWRRFIDVVICDFGLDTSQGSRKVPRVLSWDIETYTDSPASPNWRADTIRSVAVWGLTEGIDVARLREEDAAVQLSGDGVEFGVCWSVDGEHDEISVINSFIRFFNWFDPDVWSGFNDGDYDVRVLMSRCDSLCIVPHLGRNGGRPYILDRMFERQGRQREVHLVRVAGRVHLDTFNEVLADQTLFDLKGKGLNEVAYHFDFAPLLTEATWGAICDWEYYLKCKRAGVKPIDDVNHANIPDDRICETNLDDARCTFGLAQLYLANMYGLCEYLKVPLNLVVDRSPSHVDNWFFGAEFSKLGIISDGYNKDRFKQFFNVRGKPYQGAYVECLETGVFNNLEHIDFVSFYPSIMLQYNLSPETVSLVEIKPYTGEYHFEDHEHWMIIEVPDVPKGTAGRQIVCRVETKTDSVTRQKLSWVRDERGRLKSEYKATHDERLQSRQYALKVIQNTIYGYHGTGYALYGNVLCAILITALARYHIHKKIEELKMQGYKIIEVDTDGLFAVKSVD